MPALFERMVVGAMEARNRIVRAATAESLASEDGCPTPKLLGVYGELAWGGVGTIITGYVYVVPDGKPSDNSLGLYDDAFLHHYRALADVVHENGARIIMQLVYGGSKSKLAVGDPRWMASADAPSADGTPNAAVLGASSIAHPRTRLVPMEATAEQLSELAEAFGVAAGRAQSCGFDGVEVHVAHGYLLSQFLSPYFNRRNDAFGGSIENRARLAVRCVDAVRRRVGQGFPVIAKLNCWDRWDDPDGRFGGLSRGDSVQAASLLVHAGANCIEVSGDWHAASSAGLGANPYFSDYGAQLTSSLDVPVIVTGGWRNPDVAEAHIGKDGIAGIGMCRPFICEPALANRWYGGNRAPSACVGCGTCRKHPGIPCPVRERSMA